LELELFCSDENIQVICVSEHWLKDDHCNLFIPSGFVKGSLVCRNKTKSGGVSIFVKDIINFVELNLEKYHSEIDFELCGILLDDLDLYVISVYRSPAGNVNTFFELFEAALKALINKRRIIVCWDFNINFLDSESKDTLNFSNLLRSLNLTYTDIWPTRLEACLDNVIVNFLSESYVINKCCGLFADHDPLLFQYFYNNHNVNDAGVSSFIRTQSDADIEKFRELLTEKCSFIDSYINGIFNVSELFDGYLNLLSICGTSALL